MAHTALDDATASADTEVSPAGPVASWPARAGAFAIDVLVGVAVLGEHLNVTQWLAFGIALASVVLATLPSRLAWRVGSGQ